MILHVKFCWQGSSEWPKMKGIAPPWTLLSNHGNALVCIARRPGMRMRDIADCMEVSDRTAFAVVSDLIEAGYLRRYKDGNRNRYGINHEMPMRHSVLEDHWVGELLAVFAPEGLRRRHESRAPPDP